MPPSADSPGTEGTGLPHLAVLAVLTLAALALRLLGLDFALPHMIEQDGEIPNQVRRLRDDRDNDAIRRDWGTYPLLCAYLTAATSETPERYERSTDASLEEHLAASGATTRDVRRTVAVTSVLIVPATFFLARNFLGPWWSVLAAALVSLSTLNQSLSQQCRPHSVAAVFAALTFVAAVRVARRGGTAAYCLLGLAFGLALGTLHSAVALGLAIVCAHIVRADGERLGWRRLLDWRLGLALGLGAVAIPIFYPFLWSAKSTVVEPGKLTTGTHEIDAASFDGSGAEAVLRGLWFFEPVLLVLVGLALAVWAVRAVRGRTLAAGPGARTLAAYAVPYLVALTLYGKTLDRFVIPLLPVLAVFAVWGVVRLRENLGRGVLAHAFTVLVVLGLAIPAAAATQLCRIRANPDTLTEAADWVRAHAADRPVFLAPRPRWIYSNSSIDLPLARTAAALKGPGGPGADSFNLWSRYQRRLKDHAGPEPRFDIRWIWWHPKDVAGFVGPRDEFLRAHPWENFASTGPGVYLIEVFEGRPKTDIIDLRRALQRCGTLVRRLSPDRDPEYTEMPQLYRDGDGPWPHVTRRLFQARAWGPVLEIYEVTAESLARAAAGGGER